MFGKDETGRHCFLQDVDIKTIALRIRSQFAEHVLYQRLAQNVRTDQSLSREEALDIVRSQYSGADVKATTRDNYLSRLLPWFEFAGLVKAEGNSIRVYPLHETGPTYGKLPARGRASGTPMFLAGATPEVTEHLLYLALSGPVRRTHIDDNRLRNSVMDLSALGLVRWEGEALVATGSALESADATTVMKQAVLDSPAFAVFEDLLATDPAAHRRDIGLKLADKLGKVWKPSSALRYANGLHRYREHFGKS